jgi:hypothetical protein
MKKRVGEEIASPLPKRVSDFYNLDVIRIYYQKVIATPPFPKP